MKIKIPDIQELESVKSVWKNVFKDDTPLFFNYYFSKIYKKNNSLILKTNNEVASFLAWNIKKIKVDDEIFEIPLIYGVFTLEKFQKKGFMTILMNAALKKISKKYKAAIIQAYNWKVYENFNFSKLFDKKTCILNNFSSFDNQEHNLQMIKCEPKKMLEIYRIYCGNKIFYENKKLSYFKNLLQTIQNDLEKVFLTDNSYLVFKEKQLIYYAYKQKNLFEKELIWILKKLNIESLLLNDFENFKTFKEVERFSFTKIKYFDQSLKNRLDNSGKNIFIDSDY